MKSQKQRRSETIRLHSRFLFTYKKNTTAVFFSFALTFLLLSCILTFMHTNHTIANIEDKIEFSPADCYIGALSGDQVSHLRKDPSIEQLSVSELCGDSAYERNNQTVFLEKCDAAGMVMTTRVLEGRLPQKKGEIAAEKWVLLNLGIKPKAGQEFTIKNPETGEKEKVRLTGILSDVFRNKKYGTMYLYTPVDSLSRIAALQQKGQDIRFTVYLQLKEGVSYEKKIQELKKTLHLKKGQVKQSPARENRTELYLADIKVISIILLICMIVFYGVYRIASMTRIRQYGILRAVGMKKRDLQKMILLELYPIYWTGALAGIAGGSLLAYGILILSGDMEKDLYLYGRQVSFDLVIPWGMLVICLFAAGILVGAAGILTGRKAAGASVIETISGSQRAKMGCRFSLLFRLRDAGGKWSSLVRMACKYMVRDVKTSGFALLTICVCITLFMGLCYRAQILETYRNDTKEMNKLNGQYAMTMLNFDAADQGISRTSAMEINRLSQVRQVKTASGFPIRIIDEDNVRRNEAYYRDMNDRSKKYKRYELAGFDGRNQVYKSVIYGYNEPALRSLKPYVLSGDYDPADLKDDEIILSVLRTDDTKENQYPGAYREGTPLMDYKAGDRITMKYRADGNSSGMDYETFADRDARYVYKTYKIAAIVSFSYMNDCTITIYPLIITSDRQIHSMFPGSAFQCMYVDGEAHMTAGQQLALEQELIQISSKNKSVSTRSLISEIRQNNMFYRKQMVYVYGIALITFVLVLINMINNLRYRMQTRTREICMLRAVGMSVRMTRKMMLFENMILGLLAAAGAFVLSQPVLRYLYRISDMRAFGHPFHYPAGTFLLVSACALAVCMALSFGVLKEWRTKRIMEGAGRVG